MIAGTRGLGRNARKVLKRPGAFALAVIKHFRANQGLLLAGAVAYYTLLSLIPVLILILMVLSNIFDEDRILLMLREYLEFVVPGQSNALVGELRNFLAHRELVGGFLVVTMLFFSALAFTVLENAMSVIFFHRVAIRRRHFLVSATMPYLFIIFLGIGVLIVTLSPCHAHRRSPHPPRPSSDHSPFLLRFITRPRLLAHRPASTLAQRRARWGVLVALRCDLLSSGAMRLGAACLQLSA